MHISKFPDKYSKMLNENTDRTLSTIKNIKNDKMKLLTTREKLQQIADLINTATALKISPERFNIRLDKAKELANLKEGYFKSSRQKSNKKKIISEERR